MSGDLVWTGIGSRRTPFDALGLLTECARLFCLLGWTCRSGGAKGADTAAYLGCLMAKPNGAGTEIYLPWPRFSTTLQSSDHVYLDEPKPEAYKIAARYHPAWPRLERPVRSLMARNVHQILGRDLDHPTKRIVCWTPDGSRDGKGPDSGGTGMALRVAAGEAPRAIVCNIARPDDRKRVERFCSAARGRVDAKR